MHTTVKLDYDIEVITIFITELFVIIGNQTSIVE